jgi:hypothetical protein
MMVNMRHPFAPIRACIIPSRSKICALATGRTLRQTFVNAQRAGKRNGETLINMVTRIVWLERHRNQTETSALNETLRIANGDLMPARRAPTKTDDVVEWRKSTGRGFSCPALGKREHPSDASPKPIHAATLSYLHPKRRLYVVFQLLPRKCQSEGCQLLGSYDRAV